MDPAAVVAHLRARIPPPHPGVEVREDDFGNALVVQRLPSVSHLDADALNDRLHAWTTRALAHKLPAASAFVSFHRARPATWDEATLDHEETWLDVDAVFRLETERGVRAADVEAFLAEVPVFLRHVAGVGRPEGWRRVDEGVME